jgi:hypothetical protein
VRNIDFGDVSAGLASGNTDVALAWLPTPDAVSCSRTAASRSSPQDHRLTQALEVGARITGFDDAWAAVRAGQAVAASPALMLTALPGPDIVTRLIRGLTPAVLGVCRRVGDDRPLGTAFIGPARREAAG